MAAMDTGCVFIEERVALFGRQAGQLEAQRQRDHQEVQACWSVEDSIQFGLSVLESLRRLTAEWADQARTRPEEEYPWDAADRLAAVYRLWQAGSGKMLDAVRACEDRGYSVEGADELRKACREVSLMSLDVPAVRQSIQSLRQSGGTTLRQATDDLRNLAR